MHEISEHYMCLRTAIVQLAFVKYQCLRRKGYKRQQEWKIWQTVTTASFNRAFQKDREISFTTVEKVSEQKENHFQFVFLMNSVNLSFPNMKRENLFFLKKRWNLKA